VRSPVKHSPRARGVTRPGLLLFVGVAAMGLLSARGVRAEDWGVFGLASGMRRSIERFDIGFDQRASWRHALPEVTDPLYHTLLATPAIADGYVVYGTYDNRFRALDESSGAVQWERTFEDSVFASPTIYRGWAYVLSVDGRLRALRLQDGAVVWTRSLAGRGHASLTVADGSLYVASGNPSPVLMRLQPETGAVDWSTPAGALSQAAHGAPTVASGHVIVGEMNGVWRSFSAVNGATEWTAKTGGTVRSSSAVVMGDRVYATVGGDQLTTHAFDLRTGGPVAGWPFAIGLPATSASGAPVATTFVVSSPAALDGSTFAVQVRRDMRIDSDADRIADTFDSSEHVVAIDVASARARWLHAGPRLTATDSNRIPAYGLVASPAAFPARTGRGSLAIASSIDRRIEILDGASGRVLGRRTTSGSTRASIAMANAGLIVATDAGFVERWPSGANEPPTIPGYGFFPEVGGALNAAAPTLRWGAALDRDGHAISYLVRWDDDGEILHDWDGERMTDAGQTSVNLPALALGHTYTWAVRARDARGALSPWSAPRAFTVVAVPRVGVGGRLFDDLSAAVDSAAPGATVTLESGRYILSRTLVLSRGVSIVGVSPHSTVLDAQGLDVGVSLKEGAGDRPALRGLTVTGARVGVSVEATDVEVRNVILRDNKDAGLQAAASAAVRVLSATIAHNGAGIDALGTVHLRNAIVTGNDVGLAAARSGAVISRFCDVFGNATADRRGVVAGAGDLSDAVTFADDVARDLRVLTPQATTDRGDPADDASLEPQPNNGPINIGAFGNTETAEPSRAVTSGERPSSAGDGAGCRISPTMPSGSGPLIAIALALAAALRRRSRTL
jgi:outer membrane protein assembly factor BamB